MRTTCPNNRAPRRFGFAGERWRRICAGEGLARCPTEVLKGRRENSPVASEERTRPWVHAVNQLGFPFLKFVWPADLGRPTESQKGETGFWGLVTQDSGLTASSWAIIATPLAGLWTEP
jgi:hypothetical protein